jgi:hypothetical protein
MEKGTKKEMVSLRVDSKDRELIAAAAADRGLTLSAFIIESSIEAAKAKGNRRPPQGFFEKAVKQARLGGAGGYYNLGHKVATRIDTLLQECVRVSWRHRDDKFAADTECDDLKLEWTALLSAPERDDDAVLAWFYEACPELMDKIIPVQRDLDRQQRRLDRYTPREILRLGPRRRPSRHAPSEWLTNAAARRRARQFLAGVYQTVEQHQMALDASKHEEVVT